MPAPHPAPPGCILIPISGRSARIAYDVVQGWRLMVDLRDEAEAAWVGREIAFALAPTRRLDDQEDGA